MIYRVPSVWTQHHFVPVPECSGTKCAHSLRLLHGTVPEFLNSGWSAWKEKVYSHKHPSKSCTRASCSATKSEASQQSRIESIISTFWCLKMTSGQVIEIESLTKVLFRTTFTQTITLYELMHDNHKLNLALKNSRYVLLFFHISSRYAWIIGLCPLMLGEINSYRAVINIRLSYLAISSRFRVLGITTSC